MLKAGILWAQETPRYSFPLTVCVKSAGSLDIAAGARVAFVNTVDI